MNRKFVALGAGILAAGTMAFGNIGSATATGVPSTLTGTVCAALPASVTDLTNQIDAALDSIDTTAADVAAKKAALLTAINDLVPAVVSHIQAVSSGGNTAATAQILTGKSSIFVDKVVAVDAAMAANFAAQRNLYLTGLNKDYVAGVQAGLCT